MVDESTLNSPEGQEQTVAAPVDPSGSGTQTNVAVVVGAGVVLLIIAGLAAAAVYFFVLGGLFTEDTPSAPDPTEVVTPAPQEDEVVLEEPPPVELKRVFTFRDIFEPLLKPLPEPADETTPPAPTPGEPSDPAPTETRTDVSVTMLYGDVPKVPLSIGGKITEDGQTLTLIDVVSVDGVRAAVLSLDGQEHTLRAGEAIPDTPWQVLSIDGRIMK